VVLCVAYPSCLLHVTLLNVYISHDNALCVLLAAQDMLRGIFLKACAYLAHHEPESINIINQCIVFVEGLLLSRNAGVKHFGYYCSLH